MAQAGAVHPTFILLPADRADGGLIWLVGDLRVTSPTSKIVIISPSAALERAVLVALWHRGVKAYFVWEDLHPDAVLRGLDALREADVLICSRVVAEVLLAVERRQSPRIGDLMLSPHERRAVRETVASPQQQLTEREQTVAELVADGFTNAEIAAQLHISEDTVKTHVGAVLQKFGIHSRRAFGRVYRDQKGGNGNTSQKADE